MSQINKLNISYSDINIYKTGSWMLFLKKKMPDNMIIPMAAAVVAVVVVQYQHHNELIILFFGTIFYSENMM